MSEPKHIQVWNNCLSIIKDVIPESQFDTWFEPIKAVSFDGNTFTIEVPSEFFREYLDEHFIDFIGKALTRVLGIRANLVYKVTHAKDTSLTYPQQNNPELKNKSVPFPQKEGVIINPFVIPGLEQLNIDPQLNPNYTFSNFVEGECNRLGRTAGLSIAKNPGKNPPCSSNRN